MLSRATKKTDAAPDMSVFPEAPDPVTGGRQLEEIAFEVFDSESLDHLTTKTWRLAKRGVRRIFHLRVADHAVFEWHRATETWEELAAESEIHDRCFVVPIPVRAFVQRVLAHKTVAHALLATGNPVLVTAVNAARKDGLRDGRTVGLRDALRAGFAARGWALTTEAAARITECTGAETLLRWTQRIFIAQSADDVFE